MALSGVLALLSPARAVVIFSTSNGNDAGSSSPANNVNGKAVAFTMPNPLQPANAGSYTLDSLTLRFSGSALSSEVVLNLYTSAGSSPGPLIASFSSGLFTLTSAPDDYTFTPNTAVSLTSATT